MSRSYSCTCPCKKCRQPVNPSCGDPFSLPVPRTASHCRRSFKGCFH